MPGHHGDEWRKKMNNSASAQPRITKHILAVGIRSFAFSVYRTRFMEFGVTVDECESHEQAMDMLAIQKYDVVITQLVNPKTGCTDGLEVIRFVRDQHPAAKVLIMSPCGSAREKDQALTMGAAHYLAAPVFAPDVFKVLRELDIINDEIVTQQCA
jgi:DNA-binding NtrC family response regulator